jgi:hypothetical protein
MWMNSYKFSIGFALVVTKLCPMRVSVTFTLSQYKGRKHLDVSRVPK